MLAATMKVTSSDSSFSQCSGAAKWSAFEQEPDATAAAQSIQRRQRILAFPLPLSLA